MQDNSETTDAVTQSFYKKVRHQIKRIDNKASRIVFGDNNLMSRHIRSSLVHQSLKFKSDYKRSQKEYLFQRSDLYKNGFLRFEGLYDASLIKTISKKVEAAFSDPKRHVPNGPGGYSFYLSHALEDVPEIQEILTPQIIEALSNYYGTHAGIGTVNVRRNLPVDKEAPHGVYSSDWHTDQRMPVMLKMFYLVHDTTEQDGPFHVINRTATRRALETDYKNREESGTRVENQGDIVKFTGKAGTIMFVNTTQCLHKAGQPEKGRYRDLIAIQLFPSSKPLSQNWIKDKAYSRLGLGKEWI